MPMAEKKARHMVAGRIMIVCVDWVGKVAMHSLCGIGIAPIRSPKKPAFPNLNPGNPRVFSENLSFSEGPARSRPVELRLRLDAAWGRRGASRRHQNPDGQKTE